MRALLTATLLLLGLSSTLQAQTPAVADSDFAEGAQPTDPAYDAGLPVIARHRAFLPVSVDLTSRMPEVGNQGSLGSCMAWAVGYAARSYYSLSLEGRDIHRNVNLASPNYIYHLARTGSCAEGSNIPRTIDVMKKGALSLRDYPYSDACLPPPAATLVAKATDFQVRGVKRVDFTSVDNIKGQLAQSNPVVFQFMDSKGFMQHRGPGVFNEPLPPGAPTYHEMVFVGYDDRRQALRLINSWGTNWGDHGYAWLSYDLVKTRLNHAYVLDVAPPQQLIARTDPTPPRPQPAPPPVAPQRPPSPPPVQQTQVTPRPTPQVTPPTPVAPERPPAPPPVQQTQVAPPPTPQPQPVQPPPQAPPAPPSPPPTRKADLSDLPNLSCARVAVQQANGRNTLVGFVGYQTDLDLVHEIARNVPNTSADGVLLTPWPQCEALLTLEKPLTASDSPTLAINSSDLRAGENLNITVRSPAQISYLYVAYIQADGSVVPLVQPQGAVPQPTLPNQTLVFGDGLDNRPKFTVSAPFGSEMIIALASRSPLFDATLPAVETEREFLSALRRALIYKPSPDLPDREVTAAIKMLNTSAR